MLRAASRASRQRAREGVEAGNDREGRDGREAARRSAAAGEAAGLERDDKGWQQVVSCVAKLFEPFDVTVTDVAPPDLDNIVLVPVGGRPGDLGVTDRRVGGSPRSMVA